MPEHQLQPLDFAGQIVELVVERDALATRVAELESELRREQTIHAETGQTLAHVNDVLLANTEARVAELTASRERLRQAVIIAKYTLPGARLQGAIQRDLAEAIRTCGKHDDLVPITEDLS